MKLFVSIPVFLALSAFLALSDLLSFRVLAAKNYECSFIQIRNIPDEADFMAFGSSRVHIAIDPDQLQSKSQKVQTAFNMAMPGSSAIRNYSWVKGILKSE